MNGDPYLLRKGFFRFGQGKILHLLELGMAHIAKEKKGFFLLVADGGSETVLEKEVGVSPPRRKNGLIGHLRRCRFNLCAFECHYFPLGFFFPLPLQAIPLPSCGHALLPEIDCLFLALHPLLFFLLLLRIMSHFDKRES